MPTIYKIVCDGDCGKTVELPQNGTPGGWQRLLIYYNTTSLFGADGLIACSLECATVALKKQLVASKIFIADSKR